MAPRDGSGIYSAPAGTTPQAPNTTIESADWNALVADLVADANAVRPAVAGGTGHGLGAMAKMDTVGKGGGTYSAVASDNGDFWNCVGAVTINLAAAATLGAAWCLWLRIRFGTITIDPSGAETINGASTFTLADGQDCLIVCNGTTFFTTFVTGQISGKNAALASAATTSISLIVGNYVQVTGTTTITAFGTAPEGRIVFVQFAASLTLTHNATSLILPGGADIVTEAGDIAIMVSEGSGNWRCVNYMRASGAGIVYKTAVTASGTAVDFTGIPSWARRVTVILNGISTTGTSVVILQIGDSGGVATSGYTAGIGNVLAASAANAIPTNGFQLPTATAAASRTGIITLQRQDLGATPTWVASGTIVDNSGTGVVGMIAGSKAIALDRVRLTTAGGTDTFDGGGTINVTYER